ncbi:MAG: sulfatase-like hydrolase/transferase [Phycisphaerae bacterium]|jgi:arylsulfatase A-like enzyme|nr:sulfatase-like hydrolase/transferase [Phycisphaerae bacterium]
MSNKLKLQRREFLKTVVAAPLVLPAVGDGIASAAPTGPERPNVLWITCEDISANLGCYGDKYARTPNLDKLATQGVRYTSAFGVTGVCAPNRSCLITGVYPSSLGSADMRSNTRLGDSIKCFTEYLRNAGYYCTNNSKTDYNFPVPKTAWDQSSRKAHWRSRKPGQPFFAVFNYTITHESRCRKAPKDKATFDPAKVPIPPFHPDTPEVRGNWAHYYENIRTMDTQAGKLLADLKKDGLADNTIVFFFSDHGAGLPGCKKWVWRSGLHVPFIVRFPKKYSGHQPGRTGGVCDRLVSFVDFAPTVLSLAGVKIPDHMQGGAFLGAKAGKPRRYVYAHRDRMAERYDTVRVVCDADYQYNRNFMPHLTWSQFISYTEMMPTMQVWRKLSEQGKLVGIQKRYFAPTKPPEELYDAKTDPHQINNLAGDPKYKDVLTRMRTELADWMKRSGDLGLLPEYETFTRAEGSTPWQIGRDPSKNPVSALLSAAWLASAMDANNTARLAQLLKNPEPAVRYWGAIGLVALKAKASGAADALTSALTDKAPNVRIAAAEALCNIGKRDNAMNVLLEGLKHEAPFIRLRALNVLDRQGDKAKSALPQIRQAPMKSRQFPHVASYVGRMVANITKPQ